MIFSLIEGSAILHSARFEPNQRASLEKIIRHNALASRARIRTSRSILLNSKYTSSPFCVVFNASSMNDNKLFSKSIEYLQMNFHTITEID